ncbi:MAG: hypothetical protein IT431_00155 [Phycisphaerales bacterium]|nr:hypothetical protein [Phycisphaerales bacterium]
MPPDQPNNTAEVTGAEMLTEACDRNVPVEVFRVTKTGGPPARGRLLSLNDEGIVIERLQIIGEEFPHGVGTLFACYFRVGGELYSFQTKVTESRAAARLNGRLIVPALKLARPLKVTAGQRRNVFRVSVGARADAPKIDIWTADPFFPPPERAEQPPADPHPDEMQPDEAHGDPCGHAALLEPGATDEGAPAPDAQGAAQGPADAEGETAPAPPAPDRLAVPRDPELAGRMFDGSDLGVGVVIFDYPYTRLRIRGRIWLRFCLPDGGEPLEFEGLVCHTAPLREIDSRVGVRLLDDGGAAFARKVKRLTAYLTQVQREQRRI